jgi:thioesterase domain-containing protein
MASTRALLNRYRPTTYSGGAVLFRAIDDQDPRPLWTGLFADGLQIQDMPGGHLDMFTEPTVERLADLVFEHLSRIECPETSRQPVLTLQAS